MDHLEIALFVLEEAPHGWKVFEALRGEDCVDRDVVNRVNNEDKFQAIEHGSAVVVVVEAALLHPLIPPRLEVRIFFTLWLTR